MRFIVNCQEFKTLVATTSRGLAKQPTARAVMQITGTEDKPRLRITCQTGASFFQGDIEISSIDTFEEKMWGLEYTKIKSVLSVLPDMGTALTFQAPEGDGQTLTLSYLGDQINLKFYMDVQEPTINGELRLLGTVDGQTYMKSLQNMLKLVENNQASVDLATGCLHYLLEDNKIIMVATNRYSIAKLQIDFDQDEESEGTKMIKLEQGNLLINSVDANDILRLVQVGNMIGYIDNANILNLVTLANIRPLDYDPILSGDADSLYATLSSDGLKKSINNIGKLNPLEDELIIELSKDIAKVKIQQDFLEVPLKEKEGDGLINNLTDTQEIRVHRNSTTDIFSLLSTGIVKLSWEDEGDLVKFTVLNSDFEPDENLIIMAVTYSA